MAKDASKKEVLTMGELMEMVFGFQKSRILLTAYELGLFSALGNDYDLVFLSAIVHSNSPENNIGLIKKCFSALRKNGRVVIQDFIVDEDRTGPLFCPHLCFKYACGN